MYRVLKGKALRAGELNHFQSECWPYYYKLNNCIQNETGPRVSELQMNTLILPLLNAKMQELIKPMRNTTISD